MPVTRLSELGTAEIAILTIVSQSERAWSLHYSEGETDLVIEYCETQRNIDKTVIFPSFELKQGLYSMVGSVLQEMASGHQIDFVKQPQALQDGETHISRRGHHAPVRHHRY